MSLHCPRFRTQSQIRPRLKLVRSELERLSQPRSRLIGKVRLVEEPAEKVPRFLVPWVQSNGLHPRQTAYDLFNEYTRRVPSYAPAYYALGWIDTKLNRPADARRQLRHALALDPKLEDARYTLAQVELDDGKLDQAHRLLAEVLRADPHHAKANLAMGDIFFRQDKLSDAERYLENATREDPHLSAAHYKRRAAPSSN